MKKSWGLTNKILSGHKKIESRWYSVKCRPWNAIGSGDTVYFKDSGDYIRIKTKVRKVMQFTNLTPKKVGEILDKYGKDDGIEKRKIGGFFKMFKNKKYCILVFLKDPKKVKQFKIDKSGFGSMSAWITTDNVSKIKK
jgi:ASC-1-like (ASCH) protein